MIKRNIKFEASLGHEELDELLVKLEDVFKVNIPVAYSVSIVKLSPQAFEAEFMIPKKLEGEVDSVLDRQKINMSLFEVGLTGFLI